MHGITLDTAESAPPSAVPNVVKEKIAKKNKQRPKADSTFQVNVSPLQYTINIRPSSQKRETFTTRHILHNISGTSFRAL